VSLLHVVKCIVYVILCLIEHLALLIHQRLQSFLHFKSSLHPILDRSYFLLLDLDHSLVVQGLLVDLYHFDLHAPVALSDR
jgi:hypothetical protein